LRPEFTGIVVPSKFFAALAVARPFIFAGAADAAIAQWIGQYDVGAVLLPGQANPIAARLVALKGDAVGIRAGRDTAFRTYHRFFSKQVVNDRWAALLRRQLRP
jgi:hypothetical protein